MGLKVLFIGALLGLIASGGHAFALEHQVHDGLAKTSQVITLRRANTIRLVQPKPVTPAKPVTPTTPSFPG